LELLDELSEGIGGKIGFTVTNGVISLDWSAAALDNRCCTG